jgi:hypothetical protein
MIASYSNSFEIRMNTAFAPAEVRGRVAGGSRASGAQEEFEAVETSEAALRKRIAGVSIPRPNRLSEEPAQNASVTTFDTTAVISAKAYRRKCMVKWCPGTDSNRQPID